MRYFSHEHPPPSRLPRCRRWLLGTPSTALYDVITGRSFPDEKIDAEEAISVPAKQCILNPALEGVWWGSADDEDPYPSSFPSGTGAAALAVMMQNTLRQGDVPSCSFRTRWPGCVFSAECHFDYFIVLQVRYTPASRSRTCRVHRSSMRAREHLA